MQVLILFLNFLEHIPSLYCVRHSVSARLRVILSCEISSAKDGASFVSKKDWQVFARKLAG